MSERSFEEFMMNSIGLDFSFDGVFEEAIKEAEQNLEEYSEKFNIKTNRVKNALLNSVRSEIQREMGDLVSTIQPDLYRKIDLLLQAAFIAGHDTSEYFSANLISSLKSKGAEASLKEISIWATEKKKRKAWGSEGGKKEKRNPVLVEAIRNYIDRKPEYSASEIIEELKEKAEDGNLEVAGYGVDFVQRGTLYNGLVLSHDSFICYPPDPPKIAKYGYRLGAKTPGTLRNYYTKIKNGDW